MRFGTKKRYKGFLKFKRDFQKYGKRRVRGYELFLHWIKGKLNRNQFLVLSGILVGCTAGLAGVILKLLVHQIHYTITHRFHFNYQVLFYLIFPFLGIVITTIVVIMVFKSQDRKGIGAILFEIAQRSSVVPAVKMYSQMIQSGITVGLGGSAGLESPIAVTGAAIGSNFAQTYNLNYKERTLLLAAGATAGIASAFNAPIAGTMFAFEILLTGVVFSDFIPLVIAAVCGSLVSRILLQEDTLFRFYTRELFDYHNVPFYIVLGILSGLYARYFVVISKKVEHFFHRLHFSRLQKAMIGGLLLSVLCVLFPPLFGEGYDVVKSFTNGKVMETIHNSFFRYFHFSEWLLIIFLVLICLLKAFATSITINSGGNGGNFAPSLFSGGVLGFLFALVCKQLGLTEVPVTNMILVGMAGVMSGTLYAPLTAIFLIAESSSSYDLFIPLMMVSVISFLMAKWFSPISPDLKPLAEQGKIFTRAHDKNLLSLLHTEEFIDKESETIHAAASFEELLNVVKKGKKNVFAVIGVAGDLVGVLTIDEIRTFWFDKDIDQSIKVDALMKMPVAIIHFDQTMPEVVKIFDETNTWQLPVVNEQEEFLGFISKSAILTRYRELLKQYSEDEHV